MDPMLAQKALCILGVLSDLDIYLLNILQKIHIRAAIAGVICFIEDKVEWQKILPTFQSHFKIVLLN